VKTTQALIAQHTAVPPRATFLAVAEEPAYIDDIRRVLLSLAPINASDACDARKANKKVRNKRKERR